MNGAARVTFMSGPRDGETVTLTACGSHPAIPIGRSVPAGSLELGWDPDASRVHARLAWREGAWWLEDAGSRNGTFVGEFAVEMRLTDPLRIAPGQVFRCGLTRLRMEPEPIRVMEGERVALADR